MALFTDSKMAGRVSKLEADQAKILKQNEQILASLAKLTGETPTPKQEEAEDEEPKAKKKSADPKEPKAKAGDPEDEELEDEEPEEEQEDEDGEEELEDEDSEEEQEDEDEEPKTKKGKSQVKKAATPSNAAVMRELKSLHKKLDGGSQKNQAASIAKIGIQPLRRVDKPVSTDAGSDDPLEHTRQAWSKPIRK